MHRFLIFLLMGFLVLSCNSPKAIRVESPEALAFYRLHHAYASMQGQRMAMDVIMYNIANVEVSAFKGSRVDAHWLEHQPYWRRSRSRGLEYEVWTGDALPPGLYLLRTHPDSRRGALRYDPTHPDAMLSGFEEGYVETSNVVLVSEMVDLIYANRLYEQNELVVARQLAVLNGG